MGYLIILVCLFLRGILKSLIICISHFHLFLPLSSELRDDQCDPYRGDPEGNNNQTTNHPLHPIMCPITAHIFCLIYSCLFQ